MASGNYSCLLLSSFNWDDSSLLFRGKYLSSTLRKTTQTIYIIEYIRWRKNNEPNLCQEIIKNTDKAVFLRKLKVSNLTKNWGIFKTNWHKSGAIWIFGK